MALILMTCPNTGVTVATGQHATKAEAEAVMGRGGRFRCSVCREVHAWTAAEVTLTDWPGSQSSPKADGET